jgi:hypothetical protein
MGGLASMAIRIPRELISAEPMVDMRGCSYRDRKSLVELQLWSGRAARYDGWYQFSI